MIFKSTMLVDYRFLIGEIFNSLRIIRELNSDQKFEFPDITDVIFSAIESLHENMNVDVYIYHETSEEDEVQHLNGLIQTKNEIRIKVTTVSNDYYSVEIAKDIERKAKTDSIILVVGDDPVYEHSIIDSIDKAKIKVLRKSNDESSYDQVKSLCRYQDIHYAIGSAMELPIHMI